MDRVFYFESSPEKYVADAAVLTCFDARVRTAVEKFMKRRGIAKPDMIVVAGGAKTLASPRNDFERDFILEQVRMSIKLHGTTRMFLMSHSDCATYGGLAAFEGDGEKEKAHHREELKRGAALLKKTFPGLEVEPYFVTFEGVFGMASLEEGRAVS
jgi:hypothetical protein